MRPSTDLGRGPLMIDVAGPELSPLDRERLSHPAVGGVILFARNCIDAVQVKALCTAIHALRRPPLIIGIDQEGGRVQRLRQGVTRFPAQASLGRLADQEGLEQAIDRARQWGTLLGAELRALGIDLDFTPCIDLDHGVATVIGDRAFHRRPDWTAQLGVALWQGLESQGVAGVAKHFPGHGGVTADSHLALPVDARPLGALEADLAPFQALIHGGIPAIMPAHCLYPAVDPEQPAGYSRPWLQTVLRQRLGFSGVIISDDLSMQGAAGAGSVSQRVDQALNAGADLLLLCNDPAGADAALDHLQGQGAWPQASLEKLLYPAPATPLSHAEQERLRTQIAELAQTFGQGAARSAEFSSSHPLSL